MVMADDISLALRIEHGNQRKDWGVSSREQALMVAEIAAASFIAEGKGKPQIYVLTYKNAGSTNPQIINRERIL